MAAISVDGANDLPRPHDATSIGVAGEGFPPLTTVTIHIRHPALRDTADVDEDGRFVWAKTVHPRLADGASIDAVVTTADGMKIEGTGDVFGEGAAERAGP